MHLWNMNLSFYREKLLSLSLDIPILLNNGIWWYAAIYAAVIIIVHDGLQSLIMFRDLCVHTHIHTHACGGRKDATGRATISEVNLGSDRGSAGAGAFRNRRRTEWSRQGGQERGEGAKGSGGRALHAPLTRRCHRYLLLKLSYPLIHARLNAYNFGYDYRAP